MTRKEKHGMCSKRLCMTLLLMLSFGFGGRCLAQITLKMQGATLGAVIQKIQSQQHYQFFYDDALAQLPVNAIDVNNEKVEKVLELLLKGKGVNYKVIDNVVYLKQKERKPAEKQAAEKKKSTAAISTDIRFIIYPPLPTVRFPADRYPPVPN